MKAAWRHLPQWASLVLVLLVSQGSAHNPIPVESAIPGAALEPCVGQAFAALRESPDDYLFVAVETRKLVINYNGWDGAWVQWRITSFGSWWCNIPPDSYNMSPHERASFLVHEAEHHWLYWHCQFAGGEEAEVAAIERQAVYLDNVHEHKMAEQYRELRHVHRQGEAPWDHRDDC